MWPIFPDVSRKTFYSSVRNVIIEKCRNKYHKEKEFMRMLLKAKEVVKSSDRHSEVTMYRDFKIFRHTNTISKIGSKEETLTRNLLFNWESLV